MIKTIRKRDGRQVPFNIDKITNAIFKAAQAAGGSDYNTALGLSFEVMDYLNNKYKKEIPTVEDIQDIVEKILIENGHAKTSKEFILYRAERNKVRNMNSKLMKKYEDITFRSLYCKDNYLYNTPMDTMLEYGKEGAKEFYDLFILNPLHSKAHKEGDIYIHNLEFLTLTTSSSTIDIDSLFNGGFSSGYAYLREPNDIRSYGSLASTAIQINQNNQHGFQCIPNFDYYMSKGVVKTYKKSYRSNLLRNIKILYDNVDLEENIKNIFQILEKDYNLIPSLENTFEYKKKEMEYLGELLSDDIMVLKLQRLTEDMAKEETEEKTYQTMEAFIHSLNVMHSRFGSKLPYSSIDYGMDSSPEGRMVIKNILKATQMGLGDGKKPIFPVQIFKLKKGINFDLKDKNYDMFRLACGLAKNSLYPYFSFADADFNDDEVIYIDMNERLFGNIYNPKNKTTLGRGTLSKTSINLPRIALKTKNKEEFFKELKYTIDIVIEQLIERFEIQSTRRKKEYPFLMGEGVWIDSDKLNAEDELREILKNGNLLVGFTGLSECLTILNEYHHGQSSSSQKLGIEIVSYMKKLLDKISEDLDMNFRLFGNSSKHIAKRFIELDKEKFGVIENITDKEEYTTSFNLPRNYSISILDKISIEAPYHKYTDGGHFSFIEFEGDNTLFTYEKAIRYMYDKGMGLVAVNYPYLDIDDLYLE